MTAFLLAIIIALACCTLWFGWLLGRKWLDTSRVLEAHDLTIAERDAAIRERQDLVADYDRQGRILDTAERGRIKGLDVISKQDVEITALRLQVETIQKEAQEKARTSAILQATSNERIDELQATVKQKNGSIREAISKLQHAAA